jgi:hypothetical protein
VTTQKSSRFSLDDSSGLVDWEANDFRRASNRTRVADLANRLGFRIRVAAFSSESERQVNIGGQKRTDRHGRRFAPFTILLVRELRWIDEGKRVRASVGFQSHEPADVPVRFQHVLEQGRINLAEFREIAAPLGDTGFLFLLKLGRGLRFRWEKPQALRPKCVVDSYRLGLDGEAVNAEMRLAPTRVFPVNPPRSVSVEGPCSDNGDDAESTRSNKSPGRIV